MWGDSTGGGWVRFGTACRLRCSSEDVTASQAKLRETEKRFLAPTLVEDGVAPVQDLGKISTEKV